MISSILCKNQAQTLQNNSNNRTQRFCVTKNFQSGRDTVSFGAKQPKMPSIEAMMAKAKKLSSEGQKALEKEEKVAAEQSKKPSLVMNLDSNQMYLFNENHTHFWNLAFFNKGFDQKETWLTKAYDRSSMDDWSGHEYGMFKQRSYFNEQLSAIPNIDYKILESARNIREKAEYLVPTFVDYHPAAGDHFANFMNPLLVHLRQNNLVIHSEQRPDGYYDTALLVKIPNIYKQNPNSQIVNIPSSAKIGHQPEQGKSHELMTLSDSKGLMSMDNLPPGDLRQFSPLVQGLTIAARNSGPFKIVSLTPNTGRISILAKISGVMTEHESMEQYGLNGEFSTMREMPLFPDILASKLVVVKALNKRFIDRLTRGLRTFDQQIIRDKEMTREDKETIAQSLKTIMPEDGILTNGVPIVKPKQLGFSVPREEAE